MKKVYRVPIMGTIVSDKPLKGKRDDPIRPIPLRDIMKEQGVTGIDGYTSIKYNTTQGWVDVEVEGTEQGHEWLQDILSDLPQIKHNHGWVLKNER